MKLQAYVFCDCYEKNRVKRPPPNPEIVRLHPNGDNYCFRPTQAQYQAYETWRLNACRHKYGTVTGGELGHRLPREVLYQAMLPHRRRFPLFVRKVLGCKPQTRNSHLTVEQVEQLGIELAHMNKFHLPDRKCDNELQYYRGQMKQVVRAALRLKRPIAL